MWKYFLTAGTLTWLLPSMSFHMTAKITIMWKHFLTMDALIRQQANSPGSSWGGGGETFLPQVTKVWGVLWVGKRVPYTHLISTSCALGRFLPKGSIIYFWYYSFSLKTKNVRIINDIIFFKFLVSRNQMK